MRVWTKEKVISELRRTRKERNRSPDNVNAAARLLFGSLRAALDEACYLAVKTVVPSRNGARI